LLKYSTARAIPGVPPKDVAGINVLDEYPKCA